MNQKKNNPLFDVELDKVIYADRYWLAENFVGKNDAVKKRILKNWYTNFVYSKFIIESKEDIHTLCIRSLVRDDYKDLFHQITSCIKEKIQMVEDYQKKVDYFNLEASRFLIDNKWVYKLIDAECPIERNCLYIKLCSYLFILNKVQNINFKRLVLFADMQPVENLLAQYFRNKKIETVTLQHGLYIDYEELKTVNVINYKHCVSEYFLSWGNNTKSLIAKHCPETKIIVCGKPKVSLADSSQSSDVGGKFCLIVLDQRIFDQQNIEMIQLAKDSDIDLDIYVKFHPSNNKKLYYDRFSWIKEGGVINDADLVIGHTTSVIYEALAIGLKILRYKTTIPALKLPDSLQFSTLDDLNRKLKLDNKNASVAREFIECVEGSSLAKYSAFFNS